MTSRKPEKVKRVRFDAGTDATKRNPAMMALQRVPTGDFIRWDGRPSSLAPVETQPHDVAVFRREDEERICAFIAQHGLEEQWAGSTEQLTEAARERFVHCSKCDDSGIVLREVPATSAEGNHLAIFSRLVAPTVGDLTKERTIERIETHNEAVVGHRFIRIELCECKQRPRLPF